MAQAASDNTRFDPKRDPHTALSDDAMVRLCEVQEALTAIADLTSAGLDAPDPMIGRAQIASLFRLLARNTGAVIDDAPYLVN